jgi:hypothetical protein
VDRDDQRRPFDGKPPARGGLHASSTAEADRHFTVVDNHGNEPFPARVLEHLLERGRVLLDVEVLNRNVPLLIILTGGLRVGSRVFAEDHDGISHTAAILALSDLSQIPFLPIAQSSRPIYRSRNLQSIANLQSHDLQLPQWSGRDRLTSETMKAIDMIEAALR